jgi:hypothetical protein
VPFAVPLVVATVLWRFVVADARAWYSALAFSLMAASVDLLFGLISSHGTWSSWANSQMNVLPVLQSAALGGTPLVVFVVTLPAATTAVAIVRGRAVELSVLAYGLPISLTIAAIAYGFVRLASVTALPRVPIGLVASDGADLFPTDPGGASDATLAQYLEGATTLTMRGAALVMVPEKIEIWFSILTGRRWKYPWRLSASYTLCLQRDRKAPTISSRLAQIQPAQPNVLPALASQTRSRWAHKRPAPFVCSRRNRVCGPPWSFIDRIRPPAALSPALCMALPASAKERRFPNKVVSR